MRMFVAGLATLGMVASASAQDLPSQVSWTAYDVGSAGYNQAVAVGAALKDKLNVSLRVLPGKNDVARTEPLRQGRVDFSATGVGGSFMAQEGVFEFGERNWGPQKVRVLMANNGGAIALAVGVAADAGIKEYADLRGKRVAWVKGAPALNVNVTAYLAYAGLTWDDVVKVEFGGFGDAWTGMINGQVDAAFAATNSGRVYEMAASPRGIAWPPIDPNNKEAMDRMLGVAPFFSPLNATVGAGIDGGPGVPSAGYAYPVLIGMDTTPAETAYAMTKAMDTLFAEYQGKAPGINGWARGMQNFQWVVPYHDGAVRYWKEVGVWSDAAQAHNDNLIKRQEALAAAWNGLVAANPSDWDAAWDAKRREALKAGGFAEVF
ncbi:MAG: TAXI family TRAP transporter solute-binding subunit [Hyphomicrobiaceae bacterium]